MKRKALFSLVLATVLASLAGTAWAAGPDTAKFSSITTNPASTINGQNVNVTATVAPGDTIDLSFTLGTDGNGTGSTSYPDTVSFTTTTISTGSTVTVGAISGCTLTQYSSTCSPTTTLTAPAAGGAYQVKILASDVRTGNNKLSQAFFFVNFTVVVPSSCAPASTTLVLGTPACTLYHGTSVDLSATLMSGATPLSGKTITFYIDGNSIGTADTDLNGVATLSYDPTSLNVGNYAVTASWDSDDSCLLNPTITGSTLGIEYLFIGFQPPINADGSSIFSGKTIPVKIKISDANGAPVTNADASVFFEKGTPAIVGTDTENVASSLNFDYGNVMRYDSTANQYVYNWDLSTVLNGTNTVRVFLDEGTCAGAHQVTVSVQRKK
jgi:hypothetical protein